LPRIDVGGLGVSLLLLQSLFLAPEAGFFSLAPFVEVADRGLRRVELRPVSGRLCLLRGFGFRRRPWEGPLGCVGNLGKTRRLQFERIVRPDRAPQRSLGVFDGGLHRRLVVGDAGLAAGEQVLTRAPGPQGGGLARGRDDGIEEAELGLEDLQLAPSHQAHPARSRSTV